MRAPRLAFVAGIGRAVGNCVEGFAKSSSTRSGCSIAKKFLRGLGTVEAFSDGYGDPIFDGYA